MTGSAGAGTGGGHGSFEDAVAWAVSVFGATVAPRLSSGAGEPEDQMRGPLETLVAAVGQEIGLKVATIGESSLADLKVRPDYAVQVNGAICGYIEVKAPGKGADPTRWAAASHDRRQWDKLKALPNVLYTDGQSWGLFRTGEPVGGIVTLEGEVASAGDALTTADGGLARMLRGFLTWNPIPPRSLAQLVRMVAPLTRLLRDEVVDTMGREAAAGRGPFTNLAKDWRGLLFPDADDAEFADGYAQSITFALLLARTELIDFSGLSVNGIGRRLGRSHALLGKALSVLADDTIGALTVTLDTLVRVVAVVDFTRFAHHVADPYLALYEHFLAEYDPELRRQTGSYYTPASVVTAMTRLTDQVLRTHLGREQGLASDGVTVVDPAMGTGAYVLDVLESIAVTVADAEGPGAVPARLHEAAKRLVGVEKQTGPFAVAEMRVAAALRRHDVTSKTGARLYVADTLDDPFAEQAQLAATMEPIARSRRGANQMKAHEPVVVVLGNPPYREHARGHGGFVEDGAPNTAWTNPLLADFREAGNGQAEYVLSNLYVYFWRWATWKVFDAHPANHDGVVCFITTAGYLKGPGFAGMRRYLRERASHGWVIDCTPEGHQPNVATRIFGGVQQPIAIGIFTRRADTDPMVPAAISYRAVTGRRAEKFDALQTLDLDGDEWESCPTDWTAPFLPAADAEWAASPALGDLFPWSNQGIVVGRTWPYAPLSDTLNARWNALVSAAPEAKPALFRESRDASLTKKKAGLPGFPHADLPVVDETGLGLAPVPVSYRSFDVQYVLPDDRLMSTPRNDLWRVRGDHQIHTTELHAHAIKPGPALSFGAFTPDIDHFKGSAGGRVLPLYASPDTTRPNLAPGLLDVLADRLGHSVSPEDVLAYVAAITAHPGFTARFTEALRTPGIRVPLTADPALWASAVNLGRRVLWLHTRGQRCADAAAGRPSGPPRLADPQRRPKVIVAIPHEPAGMPDNLTYDAGIQTLHVGDGRIAPVTAPVVDYAVSGMNVLRKWFGYRRATRPQTRGEQSALDDLRPTAWPSAYTTDLLYLVEVVTLVVELEPSQVALLDEVMAAPRIAVDELMIAEVLPVPQTARTLSSRGVRSTADATQMALTDEFGVGTSP